MEVKPNRVSLRWNFYADIQLIRGRFWLQLWTVKQFSEPRVSWKYLAKMRKNSEKSLAFAATVIDGRGLLAQAEAPCHRLTAYSNTVAVARVYL